MPRAADAGAERFRRRLLGGKSGGQLVDPVPVPLALALGEDAPEEPFAEVVQHPADAADFDDVHSHGHRTGPLRVEFGHVHVSTPGSDRVDRGRCGAETRGGRSVIVVGGDRIANAHQMSGEPPDLAIRYRSVKARCAATKRPASIAPRIASI
jgi:hypothetical protein